MIFAYDTEFHESGPSNPLNLISIGVVSEDCRTYYAILEDFHLLRALGHPWLRENVLPFLIPGEVIHIPEGPPGRVFYGVWEQIRDSEWFKPRARVRSELEEFLGKCPQLWGYCSGYDHVCFAQIWEVMMNFPKGYPFYTRDFAQVMAERKMTKRDLPAQTTVEHNALADALWNMDVLRALEIVKE